MLARRKLRFFNSDGSPDNIFLNNNLAQAKSELFWIPRAPKKEQNYEFACVRNARISARKEVGAPLVRFQQRSDLDLIT